MKEVRGATASLRREGICRKGRRPQEMCGICLPGSSCGRVDTRPYTLTPGWCWHFQKSGDHWLTYLISSEVYSSCWNLVIFCKTDTFPIPIPKANWLNLREGCTKKGDVAKGQTFYGQWKSHPVLIYKDNALETNLISKYKELFLESKLQNHLNIGTTQNLGTALWINYVIWNYFSCWLPKKLADYTDLACWVARIDHNYGFDITLILQHHFQSLPGWPDIINAPDDGDQGWM